MSSFLAGLAAIGKNILSVVNVAQQFTPEISAIPVVGPIGSTVINAIVGVEHLFPSASGSAKKSAVMTLVNSSIPGLDQTSLGQSIDGIVTSLNNIQKVSTSASLNTLAKPVVES